MSKVEKGDIFIVPMSIRGKLNIYDQQRFKNRLTDIGNDLGISLDEDEDCLIEVWVTDKVHYGCENWFLSKKIDGVIIGFPLYLPVRLFKDKREGETVSFKWKGHDIELTLNQLGYRHKQYGPFEEVLKDLEDSYKRRWIEK